MSDRFFVQLSIGGECDADTLDELHDLCERRYGYDWWDIPDGPDRSSEHLEVGISEVAWGDISEATEFCREHKLSYNQQVEQNFDRSAYTVFWRPEMKGAMAIDTTVDGEPFICAWDLESLLGLQGPEREVRLQDLVLRHTIPELPPLVGFSDARPVPVDTADANSKLHKEPIEEQINLYREFLLEMGVPCDDDAICSSAIAFILPVDCRFRTWRLQRN